ncbi:MAG: HAD family phosphatase [bacterium]|nr:HAD family phosphatase [bacterium]
MNIKGVVFDFDGVLIPESEQVNVLAARKTFADMGLSLTEAEVGSIPGHSSKTYVPRLLQARGISAERDTEVIATNRQNYDAIWSGWPGSVTLAPHLDEVLAHLVRMGIVLAIATTNRRSVINRFLALLLAPHPFGVIVTGEDVKRHKPDPEVYQIATKHLGMSAEHLIAVEDTVIGVQAAKAAGLRCVAIPNSFTKNQDFSQADHLLGTLEELLKLIENERKG